ncbi:MAG: hypothetical protein R3C25_09915 [Hyphomonadaceae bacterium]
MLSASCHCGAVRLTLQQRPGYVNNCNCSFCHKAGAVWGYFASSEVSVAGATHCYTRADKPDPAVSLHFCPICGNTTHWLLAPAFLAKNPGVDRMGVNMRLFESTDLTGVEVRYPDGASWDGAGAYADLRVATALGPGDKL